jgi:hypothetical protein
MKKIIIVCVILFIANVGCKKTNIDGGGLCACSPVTAPELNLVIKNTAGDDLLNDKTAGAYSKDKIELFRKDGNGNIVPLNFSIRPPFSYGNEKFNFNLLTVPSISYLQTSDNNIVYLKLGEGKLHELSLQLNQGKYDLEKLLIDNKAAAKDTGNVAKYASIFYLTE